MNVKTAIMSALAIIGSSVLLWAGYTGASEGEGYRGREHATEYEEYREHETARELKQRGDILPLEQILQSAREYRDGRVLETELERKSERYVYEIELVDDAGRVWEMKFDAESGKLLGEEQED